jgi:hypothetical protein
VLFTIIAIVIVALIVALLFTRRGNKGERDITSTGVHDVGSSGAQRQNTPRGGNAAGR